MTTSQRPIHDHDDFGGLARDMPLLMQRRHLLKLMGGGAVLALATAACGNNSGSSATTATIGTTGTTAATMATTASSSTSSDEPIPEETAGPYPGDGSNGPNILDDSGVVRSDIRSSIGSAAGVAKGVVTTVTLTITDTTDGDAPLAGAALYLWHCNRDGEYSMYSQNIADENYLRGVQVADANGQVTFTTIFPACYDGRWPHMHFEVYPSLADATSSGTPRTTSQLALPQATCDLVYATDGYEQSVTNLSKVSLATDNVFGDDGGVREIPAVSGDAGSGIVLTHTIPV